MKPRGRAPDGEGRATGTGMQHAIRDSTAASTDPMCQRKTCSLSLTHALHTAADRDRHHRPSPVKTRAIRSCSRSACPSAHGHCQTTFQKDARRGNCARTLSLPCTRYTRLPHNFLMHSHELTWTYAHTLPLSLLPSALNGMSAKLAHYALRSLSLAHWHSKKGSILDSSSIVSANAHFALKPGHCTARREQNMPYMWKCLHCLYTHTLQKFAASTEAQGSPPSHCNHAGVPTGWHQPAC